MSVAMMARPQRERTIKSRPDGRTNSGKVMLDTARELSEAIGGSPTLAQQLLIRTAAQLTGRLRKMDEDFARGEPADNATYVAASGSLTAILRELGVA
jgi:hypothetical protein